VRRDHPLGAIRTIVNEALSELKREFAGLYAPIGRPWIPPEKLLRAMLLQAFYSIRSERLLMERLEYDLLFRWFAGIGGRRGLGPFGVLEEPRVAAGRRHRGQVPRGGAGAAQGDCTPIVARASIKSIKPKDGFGEPPAQGGGRNAEAHFHFHGQRHLER
jgi:hypothetical protein